jgi:wobble nucleotide-excising tRNase
VRNVLDNVERAKQRVQRCSTAALEQTVGNIGSDMSTVKEGVQNLQDTLASGVAWLESRQREYYRVVKEHSKR